MRDHILLIIGVCLVVIGFVGLAFTIPHLNSSTPDTAPTLSGASVTVDASSNLAYRPIRSLGDDWYLVEVTYPHICENPFPFGKTMMVMSVPHLVRMHASELDKLDNPEK